MRKFNLIGIDGNAFRVMGYVCRCMETVYNHFMTESRNYESESEKFANIANNYNKVARDAYTKRALCQVTTIIFFVSQLKWLISVTGK